MGLAVSEFPLDLVPYLSFTKINMFRRCPEQFRRRYLLGEKTRPAWALLAGDADHKAIAHDLEHRLGGGPGVATDEVLDLASDYIVHELDEHGGPQEYDWGKLSKDISSPGDYKLLAERERSQMLKGVSLYHTMVCPDLEPRGVESEFDMEIPGLAVPMRGYVDVELESGVGIERKTTTRSHSELPGDWRIQAWIYMLATRKPFRFDLTVRQQQTTVLPAKFTLSESNQATTVALIRQAAEQISAFIERFGVELAWPDALHHQWACKLCGWGPHSGNDTCIWWRR